MHEVLLIYRSKYGAAKAYAEMAAGRLGGLACTEQQATEQALGQARCIALFGSLYAGGLSIAPFMKKHAALLSQKLAAVFAVGATPPGPDVLEAVRARLPKAVQTLPLFYGRGAWDPARMTRVDRTLCRMLQRSVAKKPAGTLAPWEQALLEAGQGAANWIEPRYLAPLLSFLQSQC